MSDILTEENYRSAENEKKYMTYSQFSSFMECEAAALAGIEGTWKMSTTPSMLVGLYVEALLNGTEMIFKSQHPEMFKKTGDCGLLKEYAIAEQMVERVKKDEVFMSFLKGKQQDIRTGEICGVPIKTKTDYLIEGERIVDLKTVKNFELQWNGKSKVPFIESYKYDIQAAFYEATQEKYIPYYIAAITKEAVTDYDILEIPYDAIDNARGIVERLIERYADIKEHKIEPTRCECCDYCKKTKKLKGPTNYLDKKWS